MAIEDVVVDLTKLDKIQYAISVLLREQRSGIEDTLAYMEEREK